MRVLAACEFNIARVLLNNAIGTLGSLQTSDRHVFSADFKT